MSRFFKIFGKALLGIAGTMLTLMIVLEIVLSGAVLTRIVNKVATEYVDGDIHFGKVSASLFRRFPATVLTLEDFHITYPADRFDTAEKSGVQGHLVYKGTGELADTLASFRRFSVGVNLPALISGTIDVPYMRLDHPRIFAHSYADGSANWNMFKISPDQEQEDEAVDTTASEGGMPKLKIGRVAMSGKPHIVYTDSRDTIFAMINMKRLALNGKINSRSMARSRVGLRLDSMFVAGRIGQDTLALGLEKLHMSEHERAVEIDAKARAFAATLGFGRLMIPVGINGTLEFPKGDVPAVRTEDMKIDIMDVPIHARADLRFGEAFTAIDAGVKIPQSQLTHPRYPDQRLNLLLDVEAATDTKGRMNIGLKKFNAGIRGASLRASGKVRDALGNDPSISIDGTLEAHIDSLARFLPDSLDLSAGGKLTARISGSALLSQLNIYNFSKSSLTGEVLGDSITVSMPADSVNAVIDGLRIALGPEEKTSRRDSSKSFILMGISGEIAKADISYKDAIALKAKDFRVSAKNVIDNSEKTDTTRKIYPFSGKVSAGRLSLKDSEGMMVMLNESRNSFNIFPKKGQPKVPVLTLTSRNKNIFLKADANRAMFSNADIYASAAMNTVEKRQQTRRSPAQRGKRPEMPEWMTEEDFMKQDIDIRLDQNLAKYFREWDMKGRMSVDKGRVMTPYFPLRNTLNGFDLSFTNDRIGIDTLSLTSGESDISAHGELTGLRRALLGRRGSLKLDAEIVSEKMNANELLAAYTSGSNFSGSIEVSEEISEEDFMKETAIDSSALSAAPALIVVPGNINADIRLLAGNIDYADLHADIVTADLQIKERCVQITNTQAITNMGGISLEGFYSTQTKKDLKAGFSLNFKDITAEKVINLMPAVDTLMPLLKSFGGLLNCELAATSQLDTNMNLVMPSINGVMRISGEDLTIKDNDMFRKMAKLLLFKNKKEGHIDKMTVEGVIKDSKVEVFPFILEMDRYMLGLSGVQNMDMSFRYHASLIKSPFLIKLGMDIYGQDFDNMKFKIGKAKYKNRNVPVFSTVIDDTKVNLVKSIRSVFDKGVDAGMKESAAQSAIEEHKKRIGYVQAGDQKREELSSAEQKQLEAEQQAENVSASPADMTEGNSK